jgi:uncharacterized short protein YbdD (DUF466 family)
MNRVHRHVGAAAKGIGFGLKSAAVQTARLIKGGVPDYEVYIAHRREHHPAEPIMSYAEFFREREQARYTCEKGYFGGCC